MLGITHRTDNNPMGTISFFKVFMVFSPKFSLLSGGLAILTGMPSPQPTVCIRNAKPERSKRSPQLIECRKPGGIQTQLGPNSLGSFLSPRPAFDTRRPAVTPKQWPRSGCVLRSTSLRKGEPLDRCSRFVKGLSPGSFPSLAVRRVGVRVRQI